MTERNNEQMGKGFGESSLGLIEFPQLSGIGGSLFATKLDLLNLGMGLESISRSRLIQTGGARGSLDETRDQVGALLILNGSLAPLYVYPLAELSELMIARDALADQSQSSQ